MATTIPPELLLEMYCTGCFPMCDEKGRIRVYAPDPRGILPLDGFRVPHGARKTLNDPAWECRLDTSFEAVVRACAARKQTWISTEIRASYLRLHELGRAHSVEIWRGGRLVGGLYGVRCGGAFFGESMFHTVSGASKVALVKLVEILEAGGFSLLDIQWVTPHLSRFGAIEIPASTYRELLQQALARPGRWPHESQGVAQGVRPIF
jgi:leucyl/phenylalanyl-tRNA--protein transferase